MSFDFADKAVEDFYLLFPASVLTFDRFMDNDFFNQRIQKPAEPVNGQDERRISCAAVDSPARLC